MRFTKMHGAGNDYVYINCFNENVDDPEAIAREISDRHFGVGSDGLILVGPSDMGDVRMRMFNADGSESEMCGNGVRCVAKLAHEAGICQSNPIRVETGAGVMEISMVLDEADSVTAATVNMGEPILEAERIPVNIPQGQSKIIELPIRTPKHAFLTTCVSMGNPHAVIYTADASKIPLEEVGPQLEHHPMFPARINVHFVQIHSPDEVTVRTWERGSGITLACGTGASAVCVAGVLTGKTGRSITAHLPGGDLQLEWRQSDNCVYMTGPAVEVFSGQWKSSAI